MYQGKATAQKFAQSAVQRETPKMRFAEKGRKKKEKKKKNCLHLFAN
jgi:hypothetical protein